MSDLRERFEGTELFLLRKNLGLITYKGHKGGYRLNGDIDTYLNGAFMMFQELNK